MRIIMNDIVIRKANENDLPKILTLYSEIEDEKQCNLDLETAKKKLKIIMSYPNYAIYVAENEGKIVGTFELLIMDNLAHAGIPSAIVEDVVINEKDRGKGIGKLMMQYAMETSRREGCYKLMLSSNLRRERAHKFYDNLGFERHGYSFIVKL
jgi:GNAT superfamily N-acetyltransferase